MSEVLTRTLSWYDSMKSLHAQKPVRLAMFCLVYVRQCRRSCRDPDRDQVRINMTSNDSCFPACATHNILSVVDMTQGSAMVRIVDQRVPRSYRTYHCGSVHAWHYALCQCMCAKTKSCQNSSAQAVWLRHTRSASFLRHASRYCLRSKGSKLSIQW